MQVHRHVDAALHAEQHHESRGGEAAERVVVAVGQHEAAQHDKGEEPRERDAEQEAELLPRDREDEVGMRVGQHALEGALAWTLAEPGPRHEAVHRRVDLEGVAGARAVRGIEEVEDAVTHMGHELVGEKHRDRARAAEADHPEQVQPGHEEQ